MACGLICCTALSPELSILSRIHGRKCRPSGCWHLAGYVIGLGDRHSHNILIDQRSADVVHIDLGIAFEQARGAALPAVAVAAGKTFMRAYSTLVVDVHIKSAVMFVQGRFLNTPELIPFRLTRDIVDGFGIAGAVRIKRQILNDHGAPHIAMFSLREAPVGGTQAWRG